MDFLSANDRFLLLFLKKKRNLVFDEDARIDSQLTGLSVELRSRRHLDPIHHTHP